MEVFETDGIAAELHLVQDSQTVPIKISQSDLHIDETEDSIKVYVPRNKKQQQLCYFNKLPQRLYEWMMGDAAPKVPTKESETCTGILMRVLNASYDNIGDILEMSGVRDVGFHDEYQAKPESEGSVDDADHRIPVPSATQGFTYTDQDANVSDYVTLDSDSPGLATPASQSVTASSPRSQTTRVLEEAVSSQRPQRPSQGASVRPVAAHTVRSSRSPSRSSAEPSASPPIATPARIPRDPEVVAAEPCSSMEYIALLAKVIAIARRSTLPRKDSLNMSDLGRAVNQIDGQDDLATGTPFSARNSLERDKMVGAAGELYVSLR